MCTYLEFFPPSCSCEPPTHRETHKQTFNGSVRMQCKAKKEWKGSVFLGFIKLSNSNIFMMVTFFVVYMCISITRFANLIKCGLFVSHKPRFGIEKWNWFCLIQYITEWSGISSLAWTEYKSFRLLWLQFAYFRSAAAGMFPLSCHLLFLRAQYVELELFFWLAVAAAFVVFFCFIKLKWLLCGACCIYTERAKNINVLCDARIFSLIFSFSIPKWYCIAIIKSLHIFIPFKFISL